MKRAALAGAVYALALFALGFVLGTIRVMVVAPKLGELAATIVELPFMLTAAYFTCRWIVRRWQLPGDFAPRLTMAFCFFMLLLSLETLLGVSLFGRTITEQAAALFSSAGLSGLTAQVVAALFPLAIGRGAQR